MAITVLQKKKRNVFKIVITTQYGYALVYLKLMKLESRAENNPM